LAEKAQIIEANIIEWHNIMGLYASRVIVPHNGGPVDYSTATRFCDVVHSVCWTSKHLSGVCFKYSYLKKSGAPEREIERVRLRADELFEAVYRCQLVTGVPGLQARGYLLGHGETYGERVKGSRSRNAWHQGKGEYSNFRWRGDPSHHNYSDSAAGMGHYYDRELQQDYLSQRIMAQVGKVPIYACNSIKMISSRLAEPLMLMHIGEQDIMVLLMIKLLKYIINWREYINKIYCF